MPRRRLATRRQSIRSILAVGLAGLLAASCSGTAPAASPGQDGTTAVPASPAPTTADSSEGPPFGTAALATAAVATADLPPWELEPLVDARTGGTTRLADLG